MRLWTLLMLLGVVAVTAAACANPNLVVYVRDKDVEKGVPGALVKLWASAEQKDGVAKVVEAGTIGAFGPIIRGELVNRPGEAKTNSDGIVEFASVPIAFYRIELKEIPESYVVDGPSNQEMKINQNTTVIFNLKKKQ